MNIFGVGRLKQTISASLWPRVDRTAIERQTVLIAIANFECHFQITISQVLIFRRQGQAVKKISQRKLIKQWTVSVDDCIIGAINQFSGWPSAHDDLCCRAYFACTACRWVHKQNQTKKPERKMKTKRRSKNYDTLLVQLCRQFGRKWARDGDGEIIQLNFFMQ